MKYTGYKELDSALSNFRKQAQFICDNILSKLRMDLQAKTPAILKNIQTEILGSYKKIAYQEFQETFYEKYGKNYDVNSLNNSLSFYIDNNLRPHLNYDISKLIITGVFKDNPRDFNQNARIEGSFGRLMDFNEIKAIQGVFSESDIVLSNPYDEAIKTHSCVEDRDVFKNRTVIHEPKQVYKEAEIKVEKIFIEYYNSELRNTIRKKYGIKI